MRPHAVLLAALERLLYLIRGGGQKYLYLLDQFKVRWRPVCPPGPVEHVVQVREEG